MSALGSRMRWAAYGMALLATLLAVGWAGGQDDSVARPTRAAGDERGAREAASPPPGDALPALDIALLGSRAAAKSERDLFPAMNWEQAAREEALRRNPPPRPAPPPTPKAPPVPFTYMGKLVEDGVTTVFLVQGDRNLIARQGETLVSQWRVDRIDEQAMTLTYLPLKQQQVLSFAAQAAAAPVAPAAPGPVAPPGPNEPYKDQ